MKMYAIIIRPQSPFGTPPKGDTLFGQFCWQAAEDPGLLDKGLDHWLAGYHESPFAVFSSAWPLLRTEQQTWIALPRPSVTDRKNAPANRREKIEHHKALKKRKWLLVDFTLSCDMDADRWKNDEELYELFLQGQDRRTRKTLSGLDPVQRRLVMQTTRTHNTINRRTGTTGSGMFAPYTHDNIQYAPGLSLVIFAAANSQALDGRQLEKGFATMGAWGFGRDATTGLGRFTVEEVRELTWPKARDEHNACLTLGPCVPRKKTFVRMVAPPFTRFGRHGAPLAARNPFKTPVIMADEGALLYPVEKEKIFSLPWIGEAVQGISAVDKRTVMQGYSLYLPF